MPKTENERIAAKTRDSQFKHILINEFELSPKEAEGIVATAGEVYDLKNYSPSNQADKNKIVKTVVSKKAKHGPPLEELPKVNVTLTRKLPKEDKEFYRQENKPALRQTQILRMTAEALEQGGLLTQEDLSDILEVSTRTVRRDIRNIEENGFDVITRGVYQDIGPGVSHKTRIIELYLEYNTYTDIQRKTGHSPQAIKRYIVNFGRVLLCVKKDFTVKETAHTVGISANLVKEYTELYLRFNDKDHIDRIADILKLAQDKAAVKAAAKKGAKI